MGGACAVSDGIAAATIVTAVGMQVGAQMIKGCPTSPRGLTGASLLYIGTPGNLTTVWLNGEWLVDCSNDGACEYVSNELKGSKFLCTTYAAGPNGVSRHRIVGVVGCRRWLINGAPG